jgi:hypothetical protein
MSRESAYKNHKIASKVAGAQQTHVAPNRSLPTLAVGTENHARAAPSIIGAAATSCSVRRNRRLGHQRFVAYSWMHQRGSEGYLCQGETRTASSSMVRAQEASSKTLVTVVI